MYQLIINGSVRKTSDDLKDMIFYCLRIPGSSIRDYETYQTIYSHVDPVVREVEEIFI